MNAPRLTARKLRRHLRFESLESRQLLAATQIEIFAAGETGEERLDLQIDGATVASFDNVGGDAFGSVFQQLSYTHPTDVTPDQIRVAFNNNSISTTGGDTNLRVDRIEVNGQVLQTESPDVYSVGTYVPGIGCTAGFIESETLYCNGYFQYATPAGSSFEILAAGETGEEQMELQIDGSAVATFNNVGGDAFAGTFESFVYTHPTVVSIDRVRLAFTNNGVTATGGDRNLRVDKLTLDGLTYESEDPSTFASGGFVPGVGCTSGNLQTETLYCSDAYFEYSQPSNGSTFVIHATGETNEERMELQIDGTTVATFNSVGSNAFAGTFVEYRYTHSSVVTIDQVRVAFTNNGVSATGGDRNLRVDKLVLDGTTYETEADDTFSVGSYLPGLGCTSGTLQTETLYCDGYFEYKTDSNPGTLALGTTAVSVNEEDGTVSIPVIRTGGSDGAVSLNYTTVDATAIAGQDYTLTAGQAIFAPGQTTTNIVVPITNDSDDEGNETFNVATDQTTGGATLGFPRTATITILDDDGGPSIGDGNGLLGTYYNDRDLLDFEFERTDTTVNFNWGTGSPDTSLGSDTFSAVWTGQVEALYSETYTFDVLVDDGVRLWVDNQLIIDQWVNQAATSHTGQIALQGGIRTDIRMEYYENTGAATVQLRWSSPSQTFEVIPQSQLYSNPPSNIDGSFSGETLINGLNRPTAIDFAPDGRMFIAQQNGIVRVYQNGNLLAQPFVDISARVNNVQDRGLLGIAVHPDFANQPYVYLLYTYEDPNELAGSGNAGPDGRGNRVARLERFTASASSNFNQAASNTGTVILGTNSTWDNISFPDQDSTNNINLDPSCDGGTLEDCLPADSRSHTVGTVAFGTDGMLYVTNGDGTSFGQVDPRTTRVQDLDSLSGKLLRIDPLTGAGLSDNPFWTGNANDNRSKVYSYGLRNPFRMAIRPADGEPYISDVGWNTYEEINTGRGQNFGWPFYEGGDNQNLQTGGYRDLPEAAAFYANNNAVPPLWARSHADGGVAMVAGDFYTSGPYPDVLDGTLFFTDFGDPVIRAMVLNADGSFNRQIVIDDGVGATVEMTMGPDGHMYYVDLSPNNSSAGKVGRMIFTPNSSSSGNSSAGTPPSGSGAAAKGDFDTDGDTDGFDFLAWQRGYGITQSAAIAHGDSDGNGAVDQTDFAAWQTHYGTGAEQSTNSETLSQLAAAYWMADNEEPQEESHDLNEPTMLPAEASNDIALLSLEYSPTSADLEVVINEETEVDDLDKLFVELTEDGELLASIMADRA